MSFLGQHRSLHVLAFLEIWEAVKVPLQVHKLAVPSATDLTGPEVVPRTLANCAQGCVDASQELKEMRTHSAPCGPTVPLAALGSRGARPEPQEYLGTPPRLPPPLAVLALRLLARRPPC